MDDDELIEGCRRGDRRAWRALVDRYGRLVHAIPLSLGLGREDVDDVVQSTFLALLQGIDGVRQTDRLGAWLTTVARRQSIRVVERHERDRRGLVGLPADAVDDEEFSRRVEEIEWVDQALAALTPRCRRLLAILFAGDEGPSYADVAEHLGTAVGSIGPTRLRCLAALEAELARLHPDRG